MYNVTVKEFLTMSSLSFNYQFDFSLILKIVSIYISIRSIEVLEYIRILEV